MDEENKNITSNEVGKKTIMRIKEDQNENGTLVFIKEERKEFFIKEEVLDDPFAVVEAVKDKEVIISEKITCPFTHCPQREYHKHQFWDHLCDEEDHLKQDLLEYVSFNSQSGMLRCIIKGCSYIIKSNCRPTLIRHVGLFHGFAEKFMWVKYPEFMSLVKLLSTYTPMQESINRSVEESEPRSNCYSSTNCGTTDVELLHHSLSSPSFVHESSNSLEKVIPGTLNNKCRGCEYSFRQILNHLSRPKQIKRCIRFYTVKEIEQHKKMTKRVPEVKKHDKDCKCKLNENGEPKPTSSPFLGIGINKMDHICRCCGHYFKNILPHLLKEKKFKCIELYTVQEIENHRVCNQVVGASKFYQGKKKEVLLAQEKSGLYDQEERKPVGDSFQQNSNTPDIPANSICHAVADEKLCTNYNGIPLAYPSSLTISYFVKENQCCFCSTEFDSLHKFFIHMDLVHKLINLPPIYSSFNNNWTCQSCPNMNLTLPVLEDINEAVYHMNQMNTLKSQSHKLICDLCKTVLGLDAPSSIDEHFTQFHYKIGVSSVPMEFMKISTTTTNIESDPLANI